MAYLCLFERCQVICNSIRECCVCLIEEYLWVRVGQAEIQKKAKADAKAKEKAEKAAAVAAAKEEKKVQAKADKEKTKAETIS